MVPKQPTKHRTLLMCQSKTYIEIGKLEEKNYFENRKKSWMAKMNKTKCVFISAQKKENIEELKDVLYEKVKEIFRVRYPYNDFLY